MIAIVRVATSYMPKHALDCKDCLPLWHRAYQRLHYRKHMNVEQTTILLLRLWEKAAILVASTKARTKNIKQQAQSPMGWLSLSLYHFQLAATTACSSRDPADTWGSNILCRMVCWHRQPQESWTSMCLTGLTVRDAKQLHLEMTSGVVSLSTQILIHTQDACRACN